MIRSLGAFLVLFLCRIFMENAPATAEVAVPVDLPQLNQSRVTAADLPFEEIVFVKRKPYSSDHYYTDINNGTAGDRFLEKNGIYIYNARTQKERPVVKAAQLPGGKGFIGKISLSFDARKVLFDFRETARSGFRVWEVGIDGTGLRQISRPPGDEEQKASRWGKGWHTDDIHPCYLPDGRIIFLINSQRAYRALRRTGRVGGADASRDERRRRRVVQLTRSPVSEFCPVVLTTGACSITAGSTSTKGARVAKTIWTMNPDGSKPRNLYGLADDTTTVYMYPQPIPGDDSRLVCVGTCHFPQGGCVGAIFLIDANNRNRARGPDPDEQGYVKFDSRYAVANLTPTRFIERRTEPGWHFLDAGGNYVHDRNGQSGHLYTHPFPVNDKNSSFRSRSIRPITTRTSPAPIRCI
jgi:hypothetical protein